MTETEPAGYRDQIGEDEAADLATADPNIAGADHGDHGVVDHEQNMGDFVDDDEGTVAADAHTAALQPDLDGDGEPDQPGGAR